MVKFGRSEIGVGVPCFITFEVGPTHNGLASAKRLVKLAADARADAVKFQIIDADRLVSDRRMMRDYEVLVDKETGGTEIVTEPLYDILRRRMLEVSQWRELKAYCDELELAFFATVGFEDELDFLTELGCHSVKIASADVNHWPLIRAAARTGMCLQLDTGNATIGEIEAAVEVIREEGNEDIIIHQCPSGYPARLESINLNIIPTLKRMFPYPIAYSDHTPGHIMDVAALAMGADLLEKTITEDRTTRSIEHIFSLEPHEMSGFVDLIREVEIAMGKPRRILYPAEYERRKSARRSLHVKDAVRAGQSLREVSVEFRRPGYGISPDQYESLLEATFRSDLPPGHTVALSDLE